MGDYTQCIKVKEPDWQGKYCSLKKGVVILDFPVDFV